MAKKYTYLSYFGEHRRPSYCKNSLCDIAPTAFAPMIAFGRNSLELPAYYSEIPFRDTTHHDELVFKEVSVLSDNFTMIMNSDYYSNGIPEMHDTLDSNFIKYVNGQSLGTIVRDCDIFKLSFGLIITPNVVYILWDVGDAIQEPNGTRSLSAVRNIVLTRSLPEQPYLFTTKVNFSFSIIDPTNRRFCHFLRKYQPIIHSFTCIGKNVYMSMPDSVLAGMIDAEISVFDSDCVVKACWGIRDGEYPLLPCPSNVKSLFLINATLNTTVNFKVTTPPAVGFINSALKEAGVKQVIKNMKIGSKLTGLEWCKSYHYPTVLNSDLYDVSWMPLTVLSEGGYDTRDVNNDPIRVTPQTLVFELNPSRSTTTNWSSFDSIFQEDGFDFTNARLGVLDITSFLDFFDSMRAIRNRIIFKIRRGARKVFNSIVTALKQFLTENTQLTYTIDDFNDLNEEGEVRTLSTVSATTSEKTYVRSSILALLKALIGVRAKDENGTYSTDQQHAKYEELLKNMIHAGLFDADASSARLAETVAAIAEDSDLPISNDEIGNLNKFGPILKPAEYFGREFIEETADGPCVYPVMSEIPAHLKDNPAVSKVTFFKLSEDSPLQLKKALTNALVLQPKRDLIGCAMRAMCLLGVNTNFTYSQLCSSLGIPLGNSFYDNATVTTPDDSVDSTLKEKLSVQIVPAGFASARNSYWAVSKYLRKGGYISYGRAYGSILANAKGSTAKIKDAFRDMLDTGCVNGMTLLGLEFLPSSGNGLAIIDKLRVAIVHNLLPIVGVDTVDTVKDVTREIMLNFLDYFRANYTSDIGGMTSDLVDCKVFKHIPDLHTIKHPDDYFGASGMDPRFTVLCDEGMTAFQKGVINPVTRSTKVSPSSPLLATFVSILCPFAAAVFVKEEVDFKFAQRKVYYDQVYAGGKWRGTRDYLMLYGAGGLPEGDAYSATGLTIFEFSLTRNTSDLQAEFFRSLRTNYIDAHKEQPQDASTYIANLEAQAFDLANKEVTKRFIDYLIKNDQLQNSEVHFCVAPSVEGSSEASDISTCQVIDRATGLAFTSFRYSRGIDDQIQEIARMFEDTANHLNDQSQREDVNNWVDVGTMESYLEELTRVNPSVYLGMSVRDFLLMISNRLRSLFAGITMPADERDTKFIGLDDLAYVNEAQTDAAFAPVYNSLSGGA